MIHVILPFALAAILAGAGVHAILARRNAVLMLIGVELVLAAANLVLVTAGAVLPDRQAAGQVLAVFVITLAAAEVTLALGIILFAFRQRGHIDLTRGLDEGQGSPSGSPSDGEGPARSGEAPASDDRAAVDDDRAADAEPPAEADDSVADPGPPDAPTHGGASASTAAGGGPR